MIKEWMGKEGLVLGGLWEKEKDKNEKLWMISKIPVLKERLKLGEERAGGKSEWDRPDYVFFIEEIGVSGGVIVLLIKLNNMKMMELQNR